MKLIILLFLTLTCLASKINSHNQEYNIFTIQKYNQSLNQIRNYAYDDIHKYKLNIDHHVNMYSLFTKSYFERCHNYNDKNCNYTLDEQEVACKRYMIEHPKPNEYPSDVIIRRNLYYYGIYNNEIYDYLLNPDGTFFELNTQKIQYETIGMYIIEDLYDSELNTYDNKFKLFTYLNEPNDFNRRMMLYLIENENKTIFCPYWEIKL